MDKIDEIGNNVSEIKKALLGDQYNPHGIVSKMEMLMAAKIEGDIKMKFLEDKLLDYDVQLKKLNEFKKKTMIQISKATGGSVVVFFIVKYILDYYMK